MVSWLTAVSPQPKWKMPILIAKLEINKLKLKFERLIIQNSGSLHVELLNYSNISSSRSEKIKTRGLDRRINSHSENKMNHQANPHVHQQHVVLAATFRSGLPQPLSSQIFDLIKAGATQTETSLQKQHAAGERVDLLDDYDFPARTITEIK